MIFAGALTEQLDIYNIVEQQSESGFKHSEEVFLYSCYAERLQNRQNYLVDADELFHSTELKFRLRYRKEITETCMVIYQGLKYRITSIDKYPRENEEIIMLDKIND